MPFGVGRGAGGWLGGQIWLQIGQVRCFA